MTTDIERREQEQFVTALNQQLDRALNGPPIPNIDKKVGFILLIMPFGAPLGSGCTITTNGFSKEAVAAILQTQSEIIMGNPN